MPRKTLEIPRKIEWLSVLDHEGNLDKKLEPKIPAEDLRKLYKTMLNSRMFDERCFHMQRQGRIGTYGPTKGQEAASLGFAYAIGKDDWLVPSFRETAAMLWRGWEMDKILLWWAGNEAGASVAEGINDLPICVPVASQCQYGMGVAWGCKLRGKGQVCITFCGDGGTSEGDFHEAMNFAGVYQTPMVMVIQNNQWAISIPRESQTASQTIAQKAVAYGFDAFQVDGNDLLAVIVAAREAVEKARKGGGPTLIECITYRLGVHTTADDPKKYRSDDEVKEWEAKDPLPRLRDYLIKKGVLDEKGDQAVRDEIKAALDAATHKFEQYRHDQYEMFHHMFADMTPELQRQMAELKDYHEWKESGKKRQPSRVI